jgi:uncharacterized protein YkwD
MNEPGGHRRYSTLIHLFVAAIISTLLFSMPRETARAQTLETETPTAPATQPPTPTEIIDAINALRLSYGLPTLAVHPVLMTLAQRQADGVAAGLHGHWRPYGLTLGQLLIMEGYPLAGDLTQDGYRSENWIISMTAQGAIGAWLWDDEHSNTMLSEFRSDIGAGVAMSRMNGDKIRFMLSSKRRYRLAAGSNNPERGTSSPVYPVSSMEPHLLTALRCLLSRVST